MRTRFLGLVAILVSCGALAAKAEPTRPNIVIIFTDDQGYGDLGSYGLTTAKTPHLDEMAAEGTRFTSFYSQPVCGPARSALLTGRYPSRSKGWGMPASEITFAELMQDAGYATACVGKWDVSNRKPIISRMPNAKGFDYYWGPLGANDAGHVILHENNKLIGKDEDLASLSRRFTDKSIEWMTQQVEANREQKTGNRKPFLLYLCHTMMHTVIDASPEFRGRTGNGLYADTLEELDHECGRLLGTIDDLGISEETLVIFTSDNGAWSNDAERQNPKNAAHIEWTEGEQTAVGTNKPLREGKASDYEGGVRVPCLVRWPGKVPAGRVNDAIFATLDFMPTFANLAGFPVPDDRFIDGVDQTDLILGQSETGNRDTYFYHSGSHGVRQGKWKLLRANRWSPAEMERRTYPKDFGTNGVELYNLDADISETNNLADQHPQIVAELQSLALPPERASSPLPSVKRTGPKGPSKAKGKGRAKAKNKPAAIRRLHSPNIVFFMADDLGIGDVQCYNPDSTVATPHIDALAEEGTRFTDAHSPSGVCSPTRYSVLTGRYPWRDGVGGALQGVHDPALRRNQPVVSKFLGRYGYRSAMIGKWHLGLRFAGDYQRTGFGIVDGEPDFTKPLVDGPNHHGFDVFFGVNGNFDLPQHLDFWIEDDRVLDHDSIVPKKERHGRLDRVLDAWRAKDWDSRDLTRLPLKKALAFLDEHQAKHADKPFYLHFTPNAIHTGFFPNETLNGEPVAGRGGKLGPRGELIVETDIMLGAIVAKLKELGIFEETLVVFTSDNGGQGASEALEVGHRVNGPWAGCKGMILEGGHRVPYILSYPAGGVKAGAVDDETELGLVDWFPSMATYVAGPEAVAKLRPFDGADRSALFEGEKPEPHEHALIHSGNSRPIGEIEPHPIMDGPRFGAFAVREDDWKLIVEGIRGKPWALYDLGEDPGETTNLLGQHPERVERMRKRFVEAREAVGRLDPPKAKRAPERKPKAAMHSTGSGPRTNPVQSEDKVSDPDRLLPPKASRPNVILIMTDDMGHGDLSCHGNPVLKTPHLDQLHAESVRLTDYHVSTVCAPTRAALLTGKFARRTGVWTTTTDRSIMMAGIPTVSEMLSEVGYETAMYGKWHLGAVPPYRPIDRGFSESLYEPGGMIGMMVERWGNDVQDPWLQHNEVEKRYKSYRTDIWFDEAMKWMGEQQAAGKPFFTYLATLAPHGPHLVPEHYSEPYQSGDGKTRKAADFFGMIANIDENVGRLEKWLEESGLKENTILIFKTDNGGTGGAAIHNSGMRGRKGQTYDGGHRVPCFVRWPAGEILGGRDLNALTAHVDWLPTLADLCGVPKKNRPIELDGHSLAPMLRGGQDSLPERTLFVRSDTGLAKKAGYRPDPFTGTGVITPDWRLIDGRELYRIKDDPSQEADLAGEFPDVVADLRGRQEDYFDGTIETYAAPRPASVPVDGSPLNLPTLYGRHDRSEQIEAFHRGAAMGKPSLSQRSIHVSASGNYRFELRRYPAEVGVALTAKSPAIENTFSRLAGGKALPIAGARLKVGGQTFQKELPSPTAELIGFTVPLPKGDHWVTARFLDKAGKDLSDVYYLSIRRLDKKVTQQGQSAHSTGSSQRPNPVQSKKEAPDPDRLLPAKPQRFVHFADKTPDYVFDTICFSHDGEFHVFYLNGVFPPKGGPKTGVKWSHAKTSDYVHWEKLPDALLPGELDPNCWTGSVIEKDGTFYLFYTGKSLREKPDPVGDQKVMLATSTDLIHFEKQPDFTFYADGEIYWNKHVNGPLDPEREIHNQRDESFRDPEVFWNEEHDEYWMILHAREAESQKHCFGVYRSDDLLTWTPRAPLEITVPVHQRNIDCPDLFPLGDKWVLIFSGGGRYAISDKSEGPYSDHRPLDHNLFVPKTTIDETGRRFINGTVRPAKGVVGGRSSMVRELYLSDDGSVQQRPLPEVIAGFPDQVADLDDLAGNVVTGQVESNNEGLKLTRGERVARVKAAEPKDFLADFTVTLEKDSTFRLNFRRGEGQATIQTLEISTADNHIRLGTINRHTENSPPVRDRTHAVPEREPIRVQLFSVGTVTTVFIEEQVTLTMNAASLKNTDLILEAFAGAVTIQDFALNRPAPRAEKTAKAPAAAKDILFIAVDDLNTWLKLYDPSYPIHTPNLEALAARGAFFTRAYCAAPACAPSRAAVMSGQRPTTSGLYNNPNKLEDYHADTVFLPQWLHKHGYRTWGVGKLLHGEPANVGGRPIFEDFTRKTVQFPKSHLNGLKEHSPIYDWGMMEGKLSDDRTIDIASQHLKQPRQPNGPPAFQAVGIFSPHLPHFARAEHFDLYPNDKPILPPMPEDDFDDIPAAGRAMADFQKFWNQHLFDARESGDIEPLAKLVQSYQAATTYADEMIGRLLAALDETGRADDTIIVLWSDHGYHLGDKDSVVKFTLWEQATRVPLIIVAPGVTSPGTRIDTPVSLVDIYPTLVELAGLPQKPKLDGESLVPLLKDPDHPRKTPAITTFLKGNHAVVDRDWRYIRYADGSEELYQAEDVWNHENRIEQPSSAAVISKLRKWLPRE